MPTRTADDLSVPAATEAAYGDDRARVDTAYRHMRAVVAAPHPPAQVRDAASDLTVALRDATASATRALQAVSAATARPAPRHRSRRGKAGHTVPAAVRRWTAELVRLAEIAVWLRRTTLDDPGVHVPTTVRVADYAATGPHVAGLGSGGQSAAQSRGPRIGIDLTATIDGRDTVAVPATAAAVPHLAKAA